MYCRKAVFIGRVGSDARLEQPLDLLAVLSHDGVQEHDVILKLDRASTSATVASLSTRMTLLSGLFVEMSWAHGRLLLELVPLLELESPSPLGLLEALLSGQSLYELHFGKEFFVLVATTTAVATTSATVIAQIAVVYCVHVGELLHLQAFTGQH